MRVTMVDLTPSDEQKALRDLAHELAVKGDAASGVGVGSDGCMAGGRVGAGVGVGLMNAHIPAEYGGPGGAVWMAR
jgi:acyl-CoA dehydrogenase